MSLTIPTYKLGIPTLKGRDLDSASRVTKSDPDLENWVGIATLKVGIRSLNVGIPTLRNSTSRLSNSGSRDKKITRVALMGHRTHRIFNIISMTVPDTGARSVELNVPPL